MEKGNSILLRFKKIVFIGLIGLLMACDPATNNQNSQSVAANQSASTPTDSVLAETETVSASPVTQPSTVVMPVDKTTNRVPIDKTNLQALAETYRDKPLTIFDISELQLDGANALVITLSIPLNPQQDFSKVVHLVDAVTGKVDGAWELADNLLELRFRHLEPKRNLVLTVGADLLAVNGESLGEEKQSRLTTRDVQPSVGFASRGSLLPTKVIEGLPVVTQNVNSVDVNFYRINEASLPLFLNEWRSATSLTIWQSENLLSKAELVYSGRFDLNPPRNTRENLLLPIAKIEPLTKPGVYFAVMTQAGQYAYYNPATIFTLSDIGISVHRSKRELSVFTQSLENGSTLGGVNLRLLGAKGQELFAVQTDQRGYAKIPNEDKATLLLANHNGQTSLIDLGRPALDLAEFDISGPTSYEKQLFVFGPRDLYRPGETLVINGLLRDQDGRALPEQVIQADVLNPAGEVIRSFAWQPKDGLYQYQYALPASAATGNWKIRFNVTGFEPYYYTFKVEDFLPERMALDLSTQYTGPVLPSQAIVFDIQGRYLYGAPASGNSVQGQLFLRPKRSIEGYPDFEFGAINEDNLSRSLSEVDQALDSQGQGKVTVNSSWASSRSPMVLALQASLLESGGRPVTRRAEQMIWPATLLPGIRAEFGKTETYDYELDRYVFDYSVDENSIASFAVVYANTQGDKLAADHLIARLVRERRDYYWAWSQSNGWQSNYNQKEFVVAQESINIEAGGTAKLSFMTEWGAYRVEIEDPKTKVISSLRFWAGYRWQDNTNGSNAVRPDQVKLKLDKPVYRSGEKAIVHVEAPAAGKGYLLVESADGLLWSQPIDVPVGGINVEIPVDQQWKRHDIYITAQVIREGDKNQQMIPKRAVGVLHLPLAESARRLNIEIQSPEKIRPEQTINVNVKVQAQNGKIPEKINILLSAVDVGVLNITRFVTPDPFEAFLGRKRYATDQLDVYGQLIEGKGRLAMLRFGGDSDEEYSALSRGGRKPVTEVMIVAQQLQPIVLNSQGEGQLQLSIPDFNGELRLMAQGWTDAEYGKAEQKLLVAAPLVAELSAPRFMAGGDKSTLALDLRNLSGVEQTFAVAIKTEGLIQLDNQGDKQVTLADGAAEVLRIPVTAQPGYGQGRITVTVNGIKLLNEPESSFSRSWTLGVRSPYPTITRSYSTIMGNNGQFVLPTNALDNFALETLETEVLLTSRPPLNIAEYVRELYAYPYGCAEQTTSGLFPSLYSNSAQLAEMGIKSSTDEERRQRITLGISRLLNMQRDNGSFSLWSKNGEELPWLTVYVTDFLLRAREQGYAVDTAALNQAISRLQRYVQNRSSITLYYSNEPAHTLFAVRAYAALVLARENKAWLSGLRQLYAERTVSITGLPLVQLGLALKMMGDAPKGDELITLGLNKPRPADRYWLEDYGTPIRDEALILALLNEYDELPEQQNNTLLSLSEQLNGQRYLSTQERNAVFMAGRHLMANGESTWQARVNQQTLSQDKPFRKILTSAEVFNGLTITNSSATSLYTRINLSGYSVTAPKPVSNGLSIQRTFYNLKGQAITLDKLKSGELVLVSLEIKANTFVPDALVVDLLPAGLELENQNLADSSASLSQSAASLTTLQQAMQQTVIKHQEFRDDRYVAAISADQYRKNVLIYLARAVTPGVYQIPPSMVESMYRAELNAVGSTPGVLTVE